MKMFLSIKRRKTEDPTQIAMKKDNQQILQEYNQHTEGDLSYLAC